MYLVNTLFFSYFYSVNQNQMFSIDLYEYITSCIIYPSIHPPILESFHTHTL